MNPHPNGQPIQTTAFKTIAQSAETGQLNKEIEDAVQLYNDKPNPENRQTIENLIARLESSVSRQPTTDWQPTTDDLAELTTDAKIQSLRALLHNASQLDRGTSQFPIPAAERKRRNWMIRNWLPAGTIGMLTGTGAAGKSLLALQLAMSLAAGQRDWIGRQGTKECLQLDEAAPFRVVYAPYEDELNIEIADRMDWISHMANGTLYPRLEDRLHIEPMDDPIWSPPVGATRWQPAELTPAGKQLRALCEQHRADLLIVDPAAEATIIDDVDNAAIGDFIRSWRVWARTEPQCAVMLLHHLSKSDALRNVNDDDISGYRGGTAWQAGVRWLWMLKADTEQSTQDRTTAQLRPLKSSYAQTPDKVTLYREQATQWTWRAAGNTSNDSEEKNSEV